MNRSEAVEELYVSWKYRKCKKGFIKFKGGLCEECLKEGIINPGTKKQPLEVHHKIPLTDENINDPSITMNWENMELLCKKHHDKKKEKNIKRWSVLQDGRVVL